MTIKYWIKTALYRFTPGGYGYPRKLRRYCDPNFSWEQDRHPTRRKHYGDKGWGSQAEGQLRYRDYHNYQEYLEHQKQKLNEMLTCARFDNRTIVNYRLKFMRRFRHLRGVLPPHARMLCLGARQGTEVEVLRDFGFHQAWGIDVNPGPENPLVGEGDFMSLAEPDSSLDMIYSNCLDHAYDLDAALAEHARVLKPGGYALYDLLGEGDDNRGPFEAVAWNSYEEVLSLALKHFERLVSWERKSDILQLTLTKAIN